MRVPRICRHGDSIPCQFECAIRHWRGCFVPSPLSSITSDSGKQGIVNIGTASAIRVPHHRSPVASETSQRSIPIQKEHAMSRFTRLLAGGLLAAGALSSSAFANDGWYQSYGHSDYGHVTPSHSYQPSYGLHHQLHDNLNAYRAYGHYNYVPQHSYSPAPSHHSHYAPPVSHHHGYLGWSW